jgi:protein phosphatase
MEVGFKTDKGKHRKNNEDACFVIPKENVYILCDGVGGHNSGEVASRRTVSGIAEYVSENSLEDVKTFRTVKTYFNNCVQKVNYEILTASRSQIENRGMATTLVLSYFCKNKLYVLNVGDSRAYILRDGVLKQITEDHTYVNSLIKAGVITEEQAEAHENKNMITRAVGADYSVQADFFSMTIRPGDIILMCSDGLYGEIPDEKMAELLQQEKSMNDICTDLVDLANKNGGGDNITLITLKVTEDDING